MKFNYALLGIAIGLAVGFVAGRLTVDHYSIAAAGDFVIKLNSTTGDAWMLEHGRWSPIPN